MKPHISGGEGRQSIKESAVWCFIMEGAKSPPETLKGVVGKGAFKTGDEHARELTCLFSAIEKDSEQHLKNHNDIRVRKGICDQR